MVQEHLVICGASARAAAFSALRAGLRPWCVDLFADRDLMARCPAIQLSPADYPNGFVKLASGAPPGPWMYTGGLENRPQIVDKISQNRPLWGNDAQVLATVRSPPAVAQVLQAAGLPCPSIHLHSEEISSPGRWLVKPWDGAGGTGIHFWSGRSPQPSYRGKVYFQEFIDGLPCSAVFVGNGSHARLLGTTRQLVGEGWLHAAPFHYCGGIGPLTLEPVQRAGLERVGETLAMNLSLRGLFGVDFILTKEAAWPVEINPRYPASVEILEHALGIATLLTHRRVFDQSVPQTSDDFKSSSPAILGKAILFASAPLTFPRDGPWNQQFESTRSYNELPDFADVPLPGRFIPRGRPILTFFCRSNTIEDCLKTLKQIARDLDRRLYGH